MERKALGKTGLQVSKVGFGCAPLGDEYGRLDDQEGIKTIHAAIAAGINLFDTSPYYGRTLSETRLGQALKGRRDEVILATKGGRFDASLETGFDFSYDSIIRMCEESLSRLQTDWIDIYQLHDIEFGRREVVENEGIRALQDLKAAGKVRFIGVTGFPVALLRDMARDHDLDVTLSYCHANLMNDRMNTVLAPVVKEKEMGLINGSVTHMGILTHQGPQPWHPASDAVKAAGREAAHYCAARQLSLPEIAIAYALRNEFADATLLGTRTLAELQSTLDLIERPIDLEAVSALEEIIRPVKNHSWASGHPEFWEI